MTSRILPHLLEPYLPSVPPETSLTVLTSVIGASTNWLVLRHLHALLKPSSPARQHSAGVRKARRRAEGEEDDEEDKDEGVDVAVVLVSFLRDFLFWKDGCSRLGLDLEAAARRGRFAYVEGLATPDGLFSPSAPGPAVTAAITQEPRHGQGQTSRQGGWRRTVAGLTGPDDIRHIIMASVEQLKSYGVVSNLSSRDDKVGRKVVLVIDGLDFVLAAMYSNPRQDVSPGAPWRAMEIKELVMDLREETHAAIVTLAADDPLIKEQETTLEKQHAWFALSLAHEADTVFSLRLLDTGAAKDVSGVVRITNRRVHAQNHEYLYHVGSDGGVRVFERGQ
ncbi:hypothetical protein P885DRAFT_76375 [Corynascus similis CBS 632.67]